MKNTIENIILAVAFIAIVAEINDIIALVAIKLVAFAIFYIIAIRHGAFETRQLFEK